MNMRIEDSVRNAQDRELILLDRLSYQNAVSIFREKWRIPKEGLTEEEVIVWSEDHLIKSESYKATPEDLVNEKKRLQRIAQYSYAPGWLKTINPRAVDAERAFQNDISKIMQKNNLGPRWYRYLERYLLTGQRGDLPSGIQYRVGIDERSGLEIILLEITDEVTKSDLTSRWGQIVLSKKQLSYYTKIKTQPHRAFVKYREVFNKWRSGQCTMEQICDDLDAKYSKKNKEDRYGPEDVNKILSEYRKIVES